MKVFKNVCETWEYVTTNISKKTALKKNLWKDQSENVTVFILFKGYFLYRDR